MKTLAVKVIKNWPHKMICPECGSRDEKYLVQVTVHPQSVTHMMSVALCLTCSVQWNLESLTKASEVVTLVREDLGVGETNIVRNLQETDRIIP